MVKDANLPNHMPLTAVAWNPVRDCEAVNQLGYGRSVVLLRFKLVPEIMHKGASKVYFQH
jgi:hypothetical protein